MKPVKFYLIPVVLGLILANCSTQDDPNMSVKSSINATAAEINYAMKTIGSSDAYAVLSATDTESGPGYVKSSVEATDSSYTSIMLADIAGIYDYKAYTYNRGMLNVSRFFKKIADTSLMIVRLPEEKVKRPGTLLKYNLLDSTLVNNYIITVSDYQRKFSRSLGYDYKMASNINVKNENAGDLKIERSLSPENGYLFNSRFTFPDGISVSSTNISGDTALSVYAITNGDKVLYAEKYTSVKPSFDKPHREMEYSLTIGDVRIVRKRGHGQGSLDSAKVYLNDVLQVNSKVEIVITDSEDVTDSSVTNSKRTLKITFDDGTSTTISDLLGETSISTLRTLFASLRQARFATNIVDRIAWSVYMQKE